MIDHEWKPGLIGDDWRDAMRAAVCEHDLVETTRKIPSIVDGCHTFMHLAKCKKCGYTERRPRPRSEWGLFYEDGTRAFPPEK